jgi:hypothetical protein
MAKKVFRWIKFIAWRYQSGSLQNRKEPKQQKKRVLRLQIGTKRKKRATFIVNEVIRMMKSLAYWDRVLIKDIDRE